ncbi:MAG: hypothetical protein RBQ94_06615, partial [Methanimicrococcus sp.]|nr:hypothetical protein [Methanimicrococcus sp.]
MFTFQSACHCQQYYAFILSLGIILFFKLFILTSEYPDVLWRAEDETPLYIYLPEHSTHVR